MTDNPQKPDAAVSRQWQPYQLREQALKALETRITWEPDNTELQCDRARLLTELGRPDQARQAYLDVIAKHPTDFRALNNLGALLYDTGYRAAARTAYSEAVVHHPNEPVGHVNYANSLREGGEVSAAIIHLQRALELRPGYAEAHRGLAYIYRDSGDDEKARFHRRAGYAGQEVSELPYHGSGTPIFVIMLISAIGGNLPIRSLLDNRVFHVTIIVAEYFDVSLPLPPHQLFINAVGDADLSAEALEAAGKIVAKSTARIINDPAMVALTGRADNAQRLGRLPGVVAPVTVKLTRDALMQPDAENTLVSHGLSFPLLLRSAGYHTGLNFLKVDTPGDLPASMIQLPGKEFLAMQFLDARGVDQKIRKYRAMAIRRKLYPLHAAVSRQWKIHYFSADMTDDPEHRAEDERFLNDMSGVLGERGMAALAAIVEALGLDYAGIDFSLDRDGNVLLYEANANMIVPLPDADPRWDYRRPAVMRVYDAIWQMFTEPA